MEELMVKAIRKFKREHKGSEIRTVAVQSSTGAFGKTRIAQFLIEYVEEAGEEYKFTYVIVEKE